MKKFTLLLTVGAFLAFGAAQTMTGGDGVTGQEITGDAAEGMGVEDPVQALTQTGGAMTGGMMTGGAMTGGAMTGGGM